MNSLGQKLEFPLGVMLCQHPRRFRRHSREKSLSLDSHAQTLLGSFHLKRNKKEKEEILALKYSAVGIALITSSVKYC